MADVFLQEVLQKTNLGTFYGYQAGTEESVIIQVTAFFFKIACKRDKIQ